MKKYFLSLVFVFLALNTYSQNISAVVDERVELMGIVFRLSEDTRYTYNDIPLYFDEVDKYFGEHRHHPIIGHTQEFIANGFSYDAFMQAIFSVEIVEGRIKLRKDIDIAMLNKYWNRDNLNLYVDLLNEFYKATDFRSFFESDNIRQIRAVAEKNFKTVTDKIDLNGLRIFLVSSQIANVES